MFRVDRAIPAGLILLLGLSLSACSSSSGNFDPTDWISGDWFGSKPKLAGERKLVFPGGVPGVPEGVPPEMVKGNQQAVLETPTVITAEEPKPAPQPARPPQAAKPQPKPQPKPRTASAPPPQAAPARPAAAQPVNRSAAPWPDPATAQQQPRPSSQGAAEADPNAQANWPPPNPDTFSR